VNGGVDYGYNNVGVVFGAKVFSTNFAHAIELYYYLPSNSDNLYREGDYRGSTGRLGSNAGDNVGEYYCPEGYAGVGLEGSAGLAIDRLGLICGKIGDFSKVVPLPVFGGSGGSEFTDYCPKSQTLGFLTGVRVRSGSWMDSIQGLCQAAPASAPAPAKPAARLPDDLVAGIEVGTGRSELLKKLGEPGYKISGDSERFTYQLESGGTLKVDIEDGRVTRIQKIP
jgi:hypothetical protein